MRQKKQTARTLMSFLLMLAMVIGLMPGMMMPAMAADSAGTCYEKVTSTEDITAGDYLIVNENGDSGVAFNGALDTLDSTNNIVSVEISEGKIASSAEVDAAVFTIIPVNGTMRSSSGYYIGLSGKKNGLKTSVNPNMYFNKFSIDENGNAVIQADDTEKYLRYNDAKDQSRFRYYNDGTMQPVALYKKSPTTYAAYVPTEADDETALADKVVKFNGMDWYLIKDNSTSETKGSVTLLAKDSVGKSEFNDDRNDGNSYSSSKVKGVIDSLTAENGSFADVADVILSVDLADVNVSGAKLYLLSTAEAQDLPLELRKFNDYWWLRSKGTQGDEFAACVNGYKEGKEGNVRAKGSYVNYNDSIRPALQLDLSKVTFDPESKTFAANSAAVDPDRTELMNAITAANEYYDSIKNNNDFSAIAEELKAAIDAAQVVADDPDAAALNDSTAAVTDALNKAKAAVEEVLAKIEKDREDAEKALLEAKKKAVTSVTVNTKTVNAKKVDEAIKRAGGDSKYVKTIVLGKKVKKISKGAFKNCRNAKTLTVKSKKLKRSTVKKALKGSKIKKVKVKVSKKKKINKKYVKRYKKIFTKKRVGRKVKVSL